MFAHLKTHTDRDLARMGFLFYMKGRDAHNAILKKQLSDPDWLLPPAKFVEHAVCERDTEICTEDRLSSVELANFGASSEHTVPDVDPLKYLVDL